MFRGFRWAASHREMIGCFGHFWAISDVAIIPTHTHPALLKMAIPFFLIVAKSELLQLKWNIPDHKGLLWNDLTKTWISESFWIYTWLQDMNADVNDHLQLIPWPCSVLQSIEKHLSYAWSQPNQQLYCCSWVLTKSVGWYLHPFISLWQKPAYVSTLASNYEKNHTTNESFVKKNQ